MQKYEIYEKKRTFAVHQQDFYFLRYTNGNSNSKQRENFFKFFRRDN